MRKTITVIDTFGFLFRSYYALPPLRATNGFPTGLLTGFMNFIANIGKDFKTDYIVFALDSKGETFRHDIYPQYKANRTQAPDDLLRQLPLAISWIKDMGFKTIEISGFEADDIIATICKNTKQLDISTIVVSHDKDLYQLIDDKSDIYLFNPIKKEKIDENYCFEKYQVYPQNFADYQALVGDSVDNIPGVKGVGDKTAQALVSEFNTLQAIYDNIENIQKPRWQTLLKANKQNAFMSKKLVTLHDDCFDFKLEDDMKLPVENPILKIEDALIEFDMNKILQRVNSIGLSYKTKQPQKEKKQEFQTIVLDDENKLFEVLKQIKEENIVAFDTETTSKDSKTAKIVGFSFSFENDIGYYCPIDHNYLGVGKQISKQTAFEAINILNNFKLVVQNFKYDFEIIKRNFDIELKLYADTMIMAWLLDSSSPVGLDKLSLRYLSHKMIAFKDVVKKGQDFSTLDIEKASLYASEDAIYTKKLFDFFMQQFKIDKYQNFKKIAFDIEFAFVSVLITMERHGIKVDRGFLINLQKRYETDIKQIQEQIYDIAGDRFNIKSTQQLSVVLFDKLSLKATKKTKTGYSTDESVLETIKSSHIIVSYIIKYRQLNKLLSTYILPLIELSQDDKQARVYSSFTHTGTATGRLSSKNPNLQNIPVRSTRGKEIREAFVASAGKLLLSVDYSQIELRVLAHFSKDEALVKAFVDGMDIHRETASIIFGETKADEYRPIAKSINFGLIYGMGAKKLSQTINTTTKEAKNYIDSYFDKFKTVKQYLQNIEKFVLTHGYVETILGRKRFFDFDRANGMQKAGFLREAVNTVFQGTASDIIKLSMIKIEEEFKNNDDVKMLLQIHDELIFEVEENSIDEIKEKIVHIMENIYKLEVPLRCSSFVGKNWAELK